MYLSIVERPAGREMKNGRQHHNATGPVSSERSVAFCQEQSWPVHSLFGNKTKKQELIQIQVLDITKAQKQTHQRKSRAEG